MDPINIQTIDRLLTQMAQQAETFQATLKEVQEQVDLLRAENNRLRIQAMRSTVDGLENMENQTTDKFHESTLGLIEQVETQSLQAQSDETQQELSGRKQLESFYREGIHICHPYFGNRRDIHESCIFCEDVLDSLSEASHDHH